MDPLCSIIVVLLLTVGAFSSALEDKELNVHLEPTYITVCEGASVTINCTFQPSGNYKVQWFYSQTPILDFRSAYKIPEGQHFFKVKNKDWSTLNITFIKTNESGWYFCEVIQDIPILIKTRSNGTQVIVDAASVITSTTATVSQKETQNLTTGDLPTSCMNNATTIPATISPPLSSFDQWWIWLALAVGCVVLVVSIVCIFILTRKPEDIIYENTKPVESSCCRQKRTKKDICDLAASKKTDTIKPLRKYDTLSSNRIRRP